MLLLIDPRYHLKGAARAAQQHYLPAQPVQAKPPNLLEEHKGKIGYLPKGKEFLQALVELANLKHSAFKHTKDAVALYNEVLQNDVKDHLDVRAKVLQCYQDKDDQAAATAFLRQISKPSKSSSVPSSSSVVAYEEAQSAVTSSYTAVVLSLLSPPEESTNKPSKGDKKGKKDVETVPTVSLSTDELLDAGDYIVFLSVEVNSNAYHFAGTFISSSDKPGRCLALGLSRLLLRFIRSRRTS